ncbi:hypothetical protein HMPREF1531_01177 [Propionibacterium sp. oral taxon 192 str. F0372]|uniref:N-acetylmannosamine-6-phosphate 2-epimerase n=1 Tax=Propionibacterium sp. oral taxon 192 TaxID=671222 RepID=UPI000353A67B|nr:N-acetylmannosamine-6-phosphate 2-epimerase [Propionibacterium sp. oral taxon 192]EPH03752.1 hypothetical protein HMPREF1531_01177 [Propionibacterium sp. oral taxon 192 str. F0372]
MTSTDTVLHSLKGGLVVSCQAYPGEPMLDPRTMTQIAQAAETGGAAAVRGKGIDDLRGMREAVSIPIIGIVKVGDEGVYITPTLTDCLAVAAIGVEIVALDGTRRPRPDGLSLAETIDGLKQEYPEVLVMADCGSLGDIEAAAAAGADILGTTLAGYSGERRKTPGPDYELIAEAVALGVGPVLAEGRIHTPQQAANALAQGAWTVCVGTAITHPASITSWFVEALRA